MATPKQVAYVRSLLEAAGYDPRYMGSAYKRLGATMRERNGSVEAWIGGKTNHGLTLLIEQLKREGEAKP